MRWVCPACDKGATERRWRGECAGAHVAGGQRDRGRRGGDGGCGSGPGRRGGRVSRRGPGASPDRGGASLPGRGQGRLRPHGHRRRIRRVCGRHQGGGTWRQRRPGGGRDHRGNMREYRVRPLQDPDQGGRAMLPVGLPEVRGTDSLPAALRLATGHTPEGRPGCGTPPGQVRGRRERLSKHQSAPRACHTDGRSWRPPKRHRPFARKDHPGHRCPRLGTADPRAGRGRISGQHGRIEPPFPARLLDRHRGRGDRPGAGAALLPVRCAG